MKVLYNEKCSICAFEINQYKKKSEIEFLDCSKMGNKYLRRLHFISNSNELKVGLDAFIEIWSRSEGYEKLAKFFSLPLIYHFASGAYEVISFILFYRYKLTNNFNENL